MPNLTKHAERFKPWEVPNYQSFPVHRHQGTDYRLVPEAVLTKLAGQKDNLFWLTVGMSCVAIAAITAYAIDSMRPPAANASAPVIVEKPVIVDREKVVPTNCLIFCK